MDQRPCFGSLLITIILALALALLVACERRPTSDTPPEGWTGAEAAMAFRDARPETVKFFRWIVYDMPTGAEPFRIEEALICGRLVDGRYFLGHVYRHPQTRLTWSPAMVHDVVGHITQQGFEKPPTPQDVDQFLRATWWSREAPEVLRGAADLSVCAGGA